MTRINTNISSLIAQNRLTRNNDSLQTALTRLSTGLRINSGKDDPAGLIASEALRSDITSINKAISNTQRAVQIIATADSALGQVSTLLNDIRGLVVEAANRGAMSQDEIDANQLQIDSSLEAINRIAKTTTFQGRKLLDGSLDFISDVSTLAPVLDSQIYQASLGTSGIMGVDIQVDAPATRAEINNTGFDLHNAAATLNFPVRASDVLGDINVQANSIASEVTITFQHDAGLANNSVAASYDASSGTIVVSANETVAGTITKAQIAAAISGVSGFTAQADPSTATDGAGDFTLGGSPPADHLLSEASVEIQATQQGLDFNNVRVVLQAGAASGAAFDSASRTLTLTYESGVSSIADIAAAIDTLSEFSVTATQGGTAVTSLADENVSANTGTSGGGVLTANLIFELVGSRGTETFNFQTGTTNLQIAAAINLVSDATGVTALVDSSTGAITFRSSIYGSPGVVAMNIISEDSGGAFKDNLSQIRSTGVDIQARVNGVTASGEGNQLSINTSTLTLSMTLDPDQSINTLRFTITGGGALFQLGGEVATNQQARLGIGSLSTSTLGGAAGRLYELGSGQTKSLDQDIHGAGLVVTEVINKISSLRGRLGAFQATTLESNLVSLNETVNNLTQAESSIRDADFAKESAQLTRAQILVQSNTQVLGIANQSPQNVLRLLQ